MKKFIVTAFAVTLLVSAASAKQTTETLMQEYQTLQQKIAEDQQNLLRIEGAIRILEINAAETTTTAKQTTSPRSRQ